jgi:uncharacterized Zn finger protein/superfamily II DNA or RNA helicase
MLPLPGQSIDVAPATAPLPVAKRLLALCLDGLLRLANTPATADKPRKTRHASLHDAWLAALVAPEAEVSWPDSGELREFAGQLGQWRRPVELAAEAPYRFCFRLCEPPQEEAKQPSAEWRVEYLLQAKSDPSLLVAVGELWHPRSRSGRQLEKLGGKPTEYVLTSLGQAAGLSPGVAASLKRRDPDGFSLDAEEAFAFLREQAEALRTAGCGVFLPAWWVGRGPVRRLALKARAAAPKMQGGGGLSLETIVDFDLCASLGGEELSLQELRELARIKSPLVQVRGQWTQLDPAQLQIALRFLEKQQRQSLSGRELLTLALGAERQFGGLDLMEVETGGWLRELLDTLSGRREFALVAPPRGFAGELRPYQQRGLSWLAFLRQWGLGACLADDMGLGKTVQTLALVQREREAGERRPVLLVCPTTVVNNWHKEAARFTPELKVLVHHGADRRRWDDFAEAAAGYALVVSSYALLHRDSELLQQVDWAAVILDEAQNIKNPQTRQFKAARALRADFRIALTGTPVENHVGDLWALMDFLNPGLLGSQSAFRQNFYRPIQIWRDKARAERLKALAGPFMLRRLKTDRTIISDLPEKIESREFCTLSREQASLYQAVLDDLHERLARAEGMERRGLVLATLAKLKQVCNHPAHFLADGSALSGRSGKLARLEEMLLEIRENGERTLVFTQFAEMGSLLQRHLQEYFGEEVFFLHGGVVRKRRDEMVERFQHDERAPSIFVLSLKAGGTGLTLTRASHVVHFDRWWNPAVEDQATDRALHRTETQRPGAKAAGRRHPGGADRRDDRTQVRHRRRGGRQRRGMADRTFQRRPARAAAARRRSGGGLTIMSRDDFWYYPPTTPREVKGGIKAQSRRGGFAGKWWGKRWLETLESFSIGARLSRGRSYARSGQVARLNIEEGELTARVQGSRKTPYKVTIKFKAFHQEWRKVIHRLLEEPILAARLLGNELAEEMEAIFSRAGLPLFPRRQNDLVTDCTCPDWSNPCKHVAAVYYLMAEAFDNDPFLLFRLRGIERDEFLAQLREAGGGQEPAAPSAPEPAPLPLPTESDAFWGATLPTAEPLRPTPPALHAALPRRLGPLPFWRGEQPLAEEMTRLYRLASEAALVYFSHLEEGGAPPAPGDEPNASRTEAPLPLTLSERARGSRLNTLRVTTNATDAQHASSGSPQTSMQARAGHVLHREEPAGGRGRKANTGGQAALPTANQPVPARILAAMRPGRDYSRAELLAVTGISETDWIWAVRQLKEQGKVVQNGEKRGTRYQLSEKGGRR